MYLLLEQTVYRCKTVSSLQKHNLTYKRGMLKKRQCADLMQLTQIILWIKQWSEQKQS